LHRENGGLGLPRSRGRRSVAMRHTEPPLFGGLRERRGAHGVQPPDDAEGQGDTREEARHCHRSVEFISRGSGRDAACRAWAAGQTAAVAMGPARFPLGCERRTTYIENESQNQLRAARRREATPVPALGFDTASQRGTLRHPAGSGSVLQPRRAQVPRQRFFVLCSLFSVSVPCSRPRSIRCSHLLQLKRAQDDNRNVERRTEQRTKNPEQRTDNEPTPRRCVAWMQRIDVIPDLAVAARDLCIQWPAPLGDSPPSPVDVSGPERRRSLRPRSVRSRQRSTRALRSRVRARPRRAGATSRAV
jgi:hypothetical protein